MTEADKANVSVFDAIGSLIPILLDTLCTATDQPIARLEFVKTKHGDWSVTADTYADEIDDNVSFWGRGATPAHAIAHMRKEE